ncbi:uncharacterized protein LOC113382130 [Ctenocephalides felis]|uniref:uncharacterized protein LOC113382130 n=1 Tax=Ctenocephalides felis TaxID=7515 RepID=UPI000E6E1438|nr:uncharacterized protein LOC113382130 [Ctenocephalides felis]
MPSRDEPPEEMLTLSFCAWMISRSLQMGLPDEVQNRSNEKSNEQKSENTEFRPNLLKSNSQLVISKDSGGLTKVLDKTGASTPKIAVEASGNGYVKDSKLDFERSQSYDAQKAKEVMKGNTFQGISKKTYLDQSISTPNFLDENVYNKFMKVESKYKSSSQNSTDGPKFYEGVGLYKKGTRTSAKSFEKPDNFSEIKNSFESRNISVGSDDVFSKTPVLDDIQISAGTLVKDYEQRSKSESYVLKKTEENCRASDETSRIIALFEAKAKNDDGKSIAKRDIDNSDKTNRIFNLLESESKHNKANSLPMDQNVLNHDVSIDITKAVDNLEKPPNILKDLSEIQVDTKKLAEKFENKLPNQVDSSEQKTRIIEDFPSECINAKKLAEKFENKSANGVTVSKSWDASSWKALANDSISTPTDLSKLIKNSEANDDSIELSPHIGASNNKNIIEAKVIVKDQLIPTDTTSTHSALENDHCQSKSEYTKFEALRSRQFNALSNRQTKYKSFNAIPESSSSVTKPDNVQKLKSSFENLALVGNDQKQKSTVKNDSSFMTHGDHTQFQNVINSSVSKLSSKFVQPKKEMIN